MKLATGVLTLPMLGPSRLVHWLARAILTEVEREATDEGQVRAQLLDLQERYDAGGMGDEEYDQAETALLERLSAMRSHREQQG